MTDANGELGDLLRHARRELAGELRAGRAARAEDVFDRYPALAADPDSALDLIYSTEYTVREVRGDAPTPAELYGRFPQYRAALEELFACQSMLASGEADLELPVAVGGDWQEEQFQVLDALGQNGGVVVFAARQLSRDRLVAVKLLSRKQATAEELDRFGRGCEDQARLDHPNVVRVFDRGADEADLFFTMEYGDAGTLARRIGGQPQPADEAARVLRALADAVQHAHDYRVLHRDLKPANVVLMADGTPKLTDFGLAKRLDPDPTLGQTRAGDLLGTPPYMAPEQVHGHTPVDERTDVYGLGAILYEMLTGRPPCQGANELRTLNQAQAGRIARPRRHNPSVDRRLESICLRCLEHRPARRYPSARALADDLDRWQADRWPTAHLPTARASRRIRRRPLETVMLLVALAMPVCVLVAFLFSPERAEAVATARLRDGEEVTLIGPTGGPRFSRLLLPYGHDETGRSEEGAFIYGSKTLGLMELLRDPQHDRYVVRAEVRRHEVNTAADLALAEAQGKKATSITSVGFYFLHSRHPFNGGRLQRHWYWAVSFNDAPNSMRARHNLRIEYHVEPSADPSAEPTYSFALPQRPDRPWHELEVSVSPEELRVRWGNRAADGEVVWDAPTVVPRGLLEQRRDDFRNGKDLLREPQPPLAPRGSFGLYACRGSAAYRNVVVTTFPPNPRSDP